MSDRPVIIDGGVGVTALLLITAFTAYACSPEYDDDLEAINRNLDSINNFSCAASEGFLDQARSIDAESDVSYTVKASGGDCFIVPSR